MKALACTAPLHDLDSRKSQLEWADASVYQMAEIALHSIDQVALAMDFDTGAGHERILDRVTRFVALHAPDRRQSEHRKVAEWVINSLINVGNVDRGFHRPYGRIDSNGTYAVHRFDFKIIEERRNSVGELYLVASDEALNVLVGALDTDVESAQIAAEVKLDNLIVRGRLADAKLTAEQARIRTIQYAETIRAMLDATRRDVQSVDWLEAVPKLLDGALQHIGERVDAEHAIAAKIAASRDAAQEPAPKAQAAELVDIVEDCIRRHTVLQTRLIEARSAFRAEQDRQLFSGPARKQTVDLHASLLRPVLSLPLGEALAPAAGFFASVPGFTVPDQPFLATLVPLLLQPAPERSRLAGEVAEPELSATPEPNRFTTAQWDAAGKLLDLPGRVRPLSELLCEASAIDPELPHLVSLLSAHAYSPQVAAAVQRGDEHVLIAVEAGTRLEHPEIDGDELLLTSASIDRTLAGASKSEPTQ
jgi:hypothetical protein